MTIGSWDPTTAESTTGFTLDQAQLEQFIALANNDQLDQLSEQLTPEQIQQQAALMQLTAEEWYQAAEAMSSSDILSLIRFFTLAEQLPGWESGDKSPVIRLTRVLKQRGEKLERELLLWIRANSENRFLPYGSL